MAQQTASIRTRRRGKELEDALYDATLAEFAAVGYGGLTMEGIAARARTGKAALYRRWTCKHDLVHSTLHYALPPAARAPRRPIGTGESAGHVRRALRCLCRQDRVPRPGDHEPAPARAGIARHLRRRRRGAASAITESILQAGVANGEINAAGFTPYTARVGPALINQQCCSPVPRRTSANWRTSSTP